MDQLRLDAVLPAGGLGGSFSPLSSFMPKSLAFLGDKPILRRIVESICASASQPVIHVILGSFPGIARRYLTETIGDRAAFEFLEETAGVRNAGGYFCALSERISRPFLLHFTDVLAENLDFRRLYDWHESMKRDFNVIGTLAFSRNYPIGLGTMTVDDNGLIVDFTEKPNLGLSRWNMAISVFEPEIFRFAKNSDVYGSVVPNALQAGRRLAGFEHTGRWWHIHTVADLYKEHVEQYDEWVSHS